MLYRKGKLDDTKSEVFSELLEFIANAQFVEEMLKFYLYRCEKITSNLLRNSIPYKPNYEAISNSPLGRLIQRYKQFSNNEELISKLREFKPKRDAIVHAGFIKIYRDKLGEDEIAVELDGLKQINREAGNLIQLLLEEAETIEMTMKKM